MRASYEQTVPRFGNSFNSSNLNNLGVSRDYGLSDDEKDAPESSYKKNNALAMSHDASVHRNDINNSLVPQNATT